MGSQKDIHDLSPDEKPPPKGKSSTRTKKSRPTAKADTDLRSRLIGCFERLSGTLAERGDEELAHIFEEDAEVMAGGLVSLTRPFTVLRVPLLALVALVEPTLAFGRIGRVLYGRWQDRRARRARAPEGEPEPGLAPVT